MITKMNIPDEFERRLCPHRGIGEDNTLEGIERGLRLSPFLLEFDIQRYNDQLHLGHPPKVNETAALTDTLNLYQYSETMPKVDLKLADSDDELSLRQLIAELGNWSFREILVNIAGELYNPAAYMKAETILMQNTGTNVLLNIDLARYKGMTDEDVSKHVYNLDRTPFSVSPNLEADIPAAVAFAMEHNIPHVHFWSSFDKQYSREHLYLVMKSVIDSGLEVYFDIKTQNIMQT